MSDIELLDAITEVKISFKADIKDHFGNVSCNILETEERLNAYIAAFEKRVLQKVDSFGEKINHLESQLEIKLERITSLITESISKSNQRHDVLEEKVQWLQLESESNCLRIASLQIKLNQRNLLLFNFDEQEKSEKELLELLIQFFEKTMRVAVHHNDLEYAYRLGRKEDSKIRPVMIAFFTVKLRSEVLKSRVNLKDSKVIIAEDFPRENNQTKKEMPAKPTSKIQHRKANLRIKRM